MDPNFDFSFMNTPLEDDWNEQLFGLRQHTPRSDDWDGQELMAPGLRSPVNEVDLATFLGFTATFTAEELLEVAVNIPSSQLIMCCKVSEHHRTVLTPIIWGRAFARLSNEVLANIAEHLLRNDLLNFARTSKHISEVCIRIIYGDVDLSIHNRGQVSYGPLEDSEELWHNSSSWWCTNVPAKALTRQEQFLQQILQHPEYATYVMSLSWTLLLLHEPDWDLNYPYPLLGTNPNRELRDRPIRRIWEVFLMLKNVRTLDIAYMSRDHGHPLASNFPNALFPRASDIRLSGVMQYALAASILAANPAKIKQLIWDNVQQAQSWDFLYHQATERQAYQQQTLAKWNDLTHFNDDETTYFSVRGPMHNLLGSLAGCCTNLRSLTLRKTAEVGRRHTRDRSEFTRAYSSQDEDMYAEWAVFLESHKSTLERLELEQGPRDFHFPDRSRRGPAGTALVRAMDIRFNKHIWPVIMFQQGDWPSLTHLSIVGVKYWNKRSGVGRQFKEALWSKFGDDLWVSLDPKGDVMDHIGMR